ncbi:DUF805 domain-containing protein [Pelomonas sp. KK5]|uniref:DUF805 domain-containing protein n=1 Tax=Pelomonas sp. KK5 TaxID=1855730 RepID=UPI001301C0A0|nr:DUF805 domain-containing protein [Pelomonas sp. KK5]
MQDIEPVQGQTGELGLFTAQGRIGRLRYLAYVFGASFAVNIATFALALAMPGSHGLASVVSAVLGIAVFVISVTSGVKRCHDIGISGWWTLTSIIPIIVLAWIFWPGDRGSNRFGLPPPPNTWGVRILGSLAPFIVIIGILAAIAIPQYKAYTDRARAAQSVPGR